MKFTKITAVILAVLLSVSMLSGCGKDDTETAGGVTKVTIWGNGAGVNVDAEIAQKFNDTIGKEKGIEIDYQVKDGDLQQQIEIALQSGNAPDLFPAGKLKEMVEKKYVAPLSAFEGGKELVEKSVEDGGVFKENTNVINNEAYTITRESLTVGIIYNKDMFKAAGLVNEKGEPTPPETWDEFREYSKKLTDKSKRQYGVILPMKWGGWYDYDIMLSMGSSSENINFNVDTLQYDYSQMNGILNTLIGIMEDGSCYPGSEGIDNDPARARFAEGNIGMKISMSWDVGVFKEQFPASFDWGVAPVPTYSKETKYRQSMMLGNGLFINNSILDTDRKDAVWEVWKYWNGAERARILFEKGISLPVNYDIVADIKTDIHGWKEFAELTKISADSPKKISTLTTGKPSLKELFINNVWNGSMTVEEATAEFTKTANDGIEEYYKQNPSADKDADIKLITRNTLR